MYININKELKNGTYIDIFKGIKKFTNIDRIHKKNSQKYKKLYRNFFVFLNKITIFYRLNKIRGY